MEAYITLIPKEEKELEAIENYKPISLLNVDYKIMATITSNRLKKYVGEFIHPDQNGFLPKRQLRHNLRVIMDILEYYGTHKDKQMALLFLDAQKAFDNVNWKFIQKHLK